MRILNKKYVDTKANLIAEFAEATMSQKLLTAGQLTDAAFSILNIFKSNWSKRKRKQLRRIVLRRRQRRRFLWRRRRRRCRLCWYWRKFEKSQWIWTIIAIKWQKIPVLQTIEDEGETQNIDQEIQTVSGSESDNKVYEADTRIYLQCYFWCTLHSFNLVATSDIKKVTNRQFKK